VAAQWSEISWCVLHFFVKMAMEQHAFKNVNICWNTKITFYLETSGGENSILYLNVVHIFQHQCKLDICGSLRHLSFCIGVYYVLFPIVRLHLISNLALNPASPH
jgi:hypothetical protein